MDSRYGKGRAKVIDEQVLLERIQKIEKTQEQIFAALRTLIRDLNYIPGDTKPPQLTVIKPTH